MFFLFVVDIIVSMPMRRLIRRSEKVYCLNAKSNEFGLTQCNKIRPQLTSGPKMTADPTFSNSTNLAFRTCLGRSHHYSRSMVYQ